MVGQEEWLGRRSGWGGRTHAFMHVLHAILARTYALHARMPSARTHVKFAFRPFMHARLARTNAVTVHHARLACTHA